VSGRFGHGGTAADRGWQRVAQQRKALEPPTHALRGTQLLVRMLLAGGMDPCQHTGQHHPTTPHAHYRRRTHLPEAARTAGAGQPWRPAWGGGLCVLHGHKNTEQAGGQPERHRVEVKMLLLLLFCIFSLRTTHLNAGEPW
jgi:hypothetical protein